MRPSFVTQEDLTRWDKKISNDPHLPKDFGQNEKEREVLYAGCWLYEQLIELECPETDIGKIQYIAGRLSFTNDAWDVHQQAFAIYKTSLDEVTADLVPSELDDYDNLYDDEDLN